MENISGIDFGQEEFQENLDGLPGMSVSMKWNFCSQQMNLLNTLKKKKKNKREKKQHVKNVFI